MRTDLLKNSILTVTLAAGVYMPVLAQDMVVGEGPATYSPLDPRALGKDAEAGRKGLSAQSILESVARAHDASVAGSRSVVVTANTAPVPGPTPVAVYQPITNNKIKIAIYDQGYGLDAADLANIHGLLAKLPAGHLEGITEIVFQERDRYNVSAINGRLTIFYSRKDKSPAGVPSLLANAIGIHYFEKHLSPAEKAEYTAVLKRGFSVYENADATDVAYAFGAMYNNYVYNSKKYDHLAVDAESTTGRDLGTSLFVASFFISPNTPVISQLQVDNVTGQVDQSYGRAYRWAGEPGIELIALGKFNLIVENGKATSWFEREATQDKIEYENGQPIYRAEASIIHALPKPFDIPQALLHRLPLRK